MAKTDIKLKIQNTTPAASLPARLLAAAGALLAVYYKLPIPFLLLTLFLTYVMWSYYWTYKSCGQAQGHSPMTPTNIFAGETYTRQFNFANNQLFPLARCGISFSLPWGLVWTPGHTQDTTEKTGVSPIPATAYQLPPTWKHYSLHYAWLPPQREINLHLTIQARQRGIYHLPAPRLFVGDPGGLFRGLSPLGQGHLLYVFPRLQSAEELLKNLDLQETHRNNNFGLEDRHQAQGVRDYQLTDTPKSINWYATARTNSLKTNVYQRQDAQYCLVVLDVSLYHQPTAAFAATRGQDSRLEEAISLAAGIALFHLEQGAETAFYTNAPTLQWKNKNPALPGDAANTYMSRNNQISILDFAAGTGQAQKILQLCATIDETSRGRRASQQQMWHHITGAPPNTLIYFFGYHNPPSHWNHTDHQGDLAVNPRAKDFYNAARLAQLSTSRVRIMQWDSDLDGVKSAGEGEKQ